MIGRVRLHDRKGIRLFHFLGVLRPMLIDIAVDGSVFRAFYGPSLSRIPALLSIGYVKVTKCRPTGGGMRF